MAPDTKGSGIGCDNMSVVINASTPSRPLNKKTIALSYHFVREHQANHVICIRKIDSKENYADPNTKALPNHEHHSHFREFMTSGDKLRALHDLQGPSPSTMECGE